MERNCGGDDGWIGRMKFGMVHSVVNTPVQTCHLRLGGSRRNVFLDVILGIKRPDELLKSRLLKQLERPRLIIRHYPSHLIHLIHPPNDRS